MGIVAQGHRSPARGFLVRAESGADRAGCDSAVSASSGPVVLGAGIGAAGVLGAVLAVFHDAGDAGHRGQAGAGAAGKQQRQGEGTDSWETRRSEEQTSELQSIMRNSYAVFCLKKKK